MSESNSRSNSRPTGCPAWTIYLAHVCVLAAGLFFFLDNKADVDLWGNVGFVRHLPWHAGFLYENTYSYAEPHTPWVNHEWLAEWALSRVFGVLGNFGLLVCKGLIGCVLLWVMNAAMRREGCSGASRFFLLLLILSTMGYGFGVRPHLGTYGMIALFVVAIRRRMTRRRMWVPISFLLGIFWANLHGAFFVGVILLAIDSVLALCESGKDRWVPTCSLAAYFLGTLVNPYGLNLWKFVFSSASLVRPYLSEWAPLRFQEALGVHLDFVLLAVWVIGSLAVSKRRNPLDVILLCLSLVAALAMRRNIPIFAMMAGLVGAGYVDERLGPPLARLARRAPAWALCLLLSAGTVFSVAATCCFHKTTPGSIEVDPARFPVDGMRFLEEQHIHGNAIVFFDWAEEFIWHRQSDSHVFLDGRFCSAYSRRVMGDYLRFIYGIEPWDTALTAYPTDIVMVHQGNPACARMQKEPDWIAVYQDSLCAIFLKRSAHEDDIRRLGGKSPVFSVTAGVPTFP